MVGVAGLALRKEAISTKSKIWAACFNQRRPKSPDLQSGAIAAMRHSHVCISNAATAGLIKSSPEMSFKIIPSLFVHFCCLPVFLCEFCPQFVRLQYHRITAEWKEVIHDLISRASECQHIGIIAL